VKIGQSTRVRNRVEMFSRQGQYNRLMKTLRNSLKFDQSDPAKFRLHVLKYYYKYGWKPTTEAFSIGKSTLYDWKKRYEESNRSLLSLVPKKTRPKRVRQMTTDWRLVQFIRQFREQYGNVGERKIKVFLDEYANELGIPTISSRTISKVIKRRNLYFDKPKRAKRKSKFAKYRTKRSPKVDKPGYVEMDSVVVYIGGKRHNFMCCIDVYTKFAHAKKVSTLSSKQATITFQEFQQLSPDTVHTVQTDNGSEFFRYFHQYLKDQGIKHQFIYPRSPKINGIVERFNRTIKEEFIFRNDEIYFNLGKFQAKLMQYLNWYNYKRPHASLGYLSPMQFINSTN